MVIENRINARKLKVFDLICKETTTYKMLLTRGTIIKKMNKQDLPVPTEYQQASQRFSVIWNEYVDREEEAKAEIVNMVKILESSGYTRTKAIEKIISDHKQLKGFSRMTIYRKLPDDMKRKYESSNIIMLPDNSDVSNDTFEEFETFDYDIIKIKPEYASIIPPLKEWEYEGLKDAIKQFGLNEAVIVDQDNVLLDGHYRLKICRELGIKLKIMVKRFEETDLYLRYLEEKKFIIEFNLTRRHYNEFQVIEQQYALEQIENKINN